jgi:hypothetical protein
LFVFRRAGIDVGQVRKPWTGGGRTQGFAAQSHGFG